MTREPNTQPIRGRGISEGDEGLEHYLTYLLSLFPFIYSSSIWNLPGPLCLHLHIDTKTYSFKLILGRPQSKYKGGGGGWGRIPVREPRTRGGGWIEI
jgi:hypothetical protein